MQCVRSTASNPTENQHLRLHLFGDIERKAPEAAACMVESECLSALITHACCTVYRVQQPMTVTPSEGLSERELKNQQA